MLHFSHVRLHLTSYNIHFVVPSSIVHSHTCNATALANTPTRVSSHVWTYVIENATPHVRTRPCGLIYSTHAYPCHVSNDDASLPIIYTVHHRVHAHNSYTSTPPCAIWLVQPWVSLVALGAAAREVAWGLLNRYIRWELVFRLRGNPKYWGHSQVANSRALQFVSAGLQSAAGTPKTLKTPWAPRISAWDNMQTSIIRLHK